MRYFSLFSGIGGFELGIQKVSPKAICVGFSEIDKYAIRIYRRHFNGHKNYGDATKIDKLPDFDLLVGGFPCQSFSIAGKGKGFQDVRGTLFFEIARILSYKRPRYIFIENVRGLLSNQSGETFQKIIEVLTHLGYILQWEVLNSKNYGVPQNRERVFIIGHLRGESRPEVFPIGEGNARTQTPNKTSKGEGLRVATAIDSSYWKGPDGKRTLIQVGKGGDGRLHTPDMISQCLEAGTSGGGGTSNRPLIIGSVHKGKGQNAQIYNPSGISPTLRSGQGVVGRGIGSCNSPKIVSKSVRVGGRKSPHGSKQNWDSYEVNGEIRRLTPLECERLQGFPDNWTKYGKRSLISDTQRYKVLGNAVTVTVVEAIFLKFINSIGT